MYVTIWCFFWSTYFSSISTTNIFFGPHFQQTFFFWLLWRQIFFSILIYPPPPQISNGASLSKNTFTTCLPQDRRISRHELSTNLSVVQTAMVTASLRNIKLLLVIHIKIVCCLTVHVDRATIMVHWGETGLANAAYSRWMHRKWVSQFSALLRYFITIFGLAIHPPYLYKCEGFYGVSGFVKNVRVW